MQGSRSSVKAKTSKRNVNQASSTSRNLPAQPSTRATTGSAPARSDISSQNPVEATARHQASREIKEQKENSESMAESSSRRPKSSGHPMVKGVFYSCDLLGPELDTYDHIRTKIKEFLYKMSQDPVTASMLILRSCNDADKATTGIDTLSRYLRNIADHPGEEKYRKIRIFNRVFQERVFNLVGALEFLDAIGFKRVDLPGADGNKEPYLVFSQEDVGDLPSLIDDLARVEPIVPKLDRNLQVLSPSVAAARIDLPPQFFNLSLDELRREQAQRKRRAELLTQMRTSEQRRRDEIFSMPRHYDHTVIRVKMPKNVILQGTFSAEERLQDVEEFVRAQLSDPSAEFELRGPGGEKLDSASTLAALELVPAAVVNLQPRLHAPAMASAALARLEKSSHETPL